MKKLLEIVNSSIIRSLTIIGICMALLLLQLFFPYLYYSSSDRKPNSEFQVGITTSTNKTQSAPSTPRFNTSTILISG